MSRGNKNITELTADQLNAMEAQARVMLSTAKKTLRLCREARGRIVTSMGVSTSIPGHPGKTMDDIIREALEKREKKRRMQISMKKAEVGTSARQ